MIITTLGIQNPAFTELPSASASGSHLSICIFVALTTSLSPQGCQDSFLCSLRRSQYFLVKECVCILGKTFDDHALKKVEAWYLSCTRPNIKVFILLPLNEGQHTLQEEGKFSSFDVGSISWIDGAKELSIRLRESCCHEGTRTDSAAWGRFRH